MKKYELPLTRDYCRDWTPVEALREIIQNALDYCDGKLDATIDEDGISIRSLGARLEPRTLLLGCTSKADDEDSIGSFGEGYKIALLVLARENIDVEVYNCGAIWRPKFEMSKTFGEETLVIEESSEINLFNPQAVIFTIRGLSEEDKAKVIENTLQLQPPDFNFHPVSQGQILLDKKGKLYVNGLFVSDTDMEYGYNVKPQHIKLERDRKTVDHWDLKFLAKDMWFDARVPNKVATLMEEGIPDLQYAQYSCPELVMEACYKVFRAKHPTAVIASSQAELEQKIKDGMTEVVVYRESFASAIQNYAQYKEEIPKTAKVTPSQRLKSFFADNKDGMDRKTKEAFRELIKEFETLK